jgi:hypothetical protein
MMEAVRISETSVCSDENTRRYIPEDCKLHIRRRENLKSHIHKLVSILNKEENELLIMHLVTWCVTYLLSLLKVKSSVVLLQVVTLSVYTYFIAALMGRQFILSDTDMFFPFFTVLQVSACCRPSRVICSSLNTDSRSAVRICLHLVFINVFTTTRHLCDSITI